MQSGTFVLINADGLDAEFGVVYYTCERKYADGTFTMSKVLVEDGSFLWLRQDEMVIPPFVPNHIKDELQRIYDRVE